MVMTNGFSISNHPLNYIGIMLLLLSEPKVGIKFCPLKVNSKNIGPFSTKRESPFKASPKRTELSIIVISIIQLMFDTRCICGSRHTKNIVANFCYSCNTASD